MVAAAGRYARAFADIVAARGLDAEKTAQDLGQIAELMASSHELRNVLLNPSVEHKQKIGLLDAIIQRSGGTRLLRNFIAVLIDHKRVGQISEIAQQFNSQLAERLGIAEARISSARELSPAEKQSLERRLVAVTGKKVRAVYLEDAGLLGGAVVRIGSTIYDGSVRGQLEKLREELVNSNLEIE